MFIELVESNRKTKRSSAGTVVSIALHTALIVVAIAATANARTEPEHKIPGTRLHYLPTRAARTDVPVVRETQSRPVIKPAPLASAAPVIAPVTVATGIPAITTVSAPVETDNGPTSNGSGANGGGEASGENTGAGPLTEFQVDRAVRAFRSNRAPAYPDVLRAQGVEGEVLTRFVVNESGRVEMKTVEILSVSSPAFASAVRYALERARFEPAEAAGQKVAQLVEQRFQFRLDGR